MHAPMMKEKWLQASRNEERTNGYLPPMIATNTNRVQIWLSYNTEKKYVWEKSSMKKYRSLHLIKTKNMQNFQTYRKL
jgi:hypothetical protein